MTVIHEIWHNDAEWGSRLNLKCISCYFLFLKIQDGGQPIRLIDPFCITTRCRVSLIVNMAAVSHHEFLKLKFLTAVHFKDTL